MLRLTCNRAMRVGALALACLHLAAAGRFSKYKTCESCVAAGYGWNTGASKCGGFSNKVCPTAAASFAGGKGDDELCGTEGPTEECGADGDAAAEGGIAGEIKAMYEVHNPAKLPELAALLKTYAGREGKLLAAIKAKYTNAVIALDMAKFKDFVNTDALALVEFYAPWCGHCKSLAPEYEAAAKELKPDGLVVLGKVDATANKELAGQYEVNGYPALKVFRSNLLEPWDYNGPRTADGIVGTMQQMAKSLQKDPSWTPPKMDDIAPPPPPDALTPHPKDNSPGCKDLFDEKYGKGYCAKRHNEALCMDDKHVGFSNMCKLTCGICAGHDMMPHLVTDYFLGERKADNGEMQYQVRWRDVGAEWDSWEWESQQNPSDPIWRRAKKVWDSKNKPAAETDDEVIELNDDI